MEIAFNKAEATIKSHPEAKKIYVELSDLNKQSIIDLLANEAIIDNVGIGQINKLIVMNYISEVNYKIDPKVAEIFKNITMPQYSSFTIGPPLNTKECK